MRHYFALFKKYFSSIDFYSIFWFLKSIVNYYLTEKSINEIKIFLDCEEFEKLKTKIWNWDCNNSNISSIILNHCINTRSYDSLDYILSRNMIGINCKLDLYEWTVFHRAAYNKDFKLLRIIMRYGAKIDVIDSNGNTPFHVIIQSLKHESYKTFTSKNDAIDSEPVLNLLEAMIDYSQAPNRNILNIRNNFGKTALHYAVVNMNFKNQSLINIIISTLITNGANPDIEDKQNRTPLYCAIDEHYVCDEQKNVIQTLVDAKCDSLNLYQFKNLGQTKNFTLKQFCRSYLLKSFPKILSSNLNIHLPQELVSYLRRKLIFV